MGEFFYGMWLVIWIPVRGIAILLGRIARHIARVSWQHAYRALFGNWRRTTGTVLVGSLALVHYYPTQQNAAVAGIVWTFFFLALGLWFLTWGARALLGGGGGGNRQRRNRH